MATCKIKNGKYYISFYYTSLDGKKLRKKKEGFKTKKEAFQFEKDFILNERGGDTELTFDFLVKKYLEDSKARVKPTTYELNEYLINRKILPYFKGLKIKNIEPKTIRSWQNSLLLENKYKPTYLRAINIKLNNIFN